MRNMRRKKNAINKQNTPKKNWKKAKKKLANDARKTDKAAKVQRHLRHGRA